VRAHPPRSSCPRRKSDHEDVLVVADPGRVFCQGTDHRLVQTPRGPIIDVLHAGRSAQRKPNAIPVGQQKLFAFPPESVFAFRAECCSESQRNGVRLQTGIAFTFDRIPHTAQSQVRSKAKTPRISARNTGPAIFVLSGVIVRLNGCGNYALSERPIDRWDTRCSTLVSSWLLARLSGRWCASTKQLAGCNLQSDYMDLAQTSAKKRRRGFLWRFLLTAPLQFVP